jgi:hypothetical protein
MTCRVASAPEPARALRRAIPDVYDGYRRMHAAANAAGGAGQEDEATGPLAIAVSKECDGCIARMLVAPPAPAPPSRRSPKRSASPPR